MGRYLNNAQHHAKKIAHFYKNAGKAGYRQAEYHWHELSGLELSAARSKNNKSDATLIHAIKESVQHMMDEMKRRESIG
ncbi:hypothetical protein BMS3Abin10_00551 [bacterium BMS3Abin10]|nr:hypothetical protein BMS3Abin10_00551 [bacterium BMS3Abin10]